MKNYFVSCSAQSFLFSVSNPPWQIKIIRAENFRMRYPLSRLLNLSIQWTHSWFFFLNRSFFDIVEKDQKPVFNIREFQLLYINLKWRAKFQIYRLKIRDSDWFNFIHFICNKYKTRLVSILKKRGSSINLYIHHSKVFSSDLIN